MRFQSPVLIFITLLVTSCSPSGETPPSRTIALTFDDAPRSDGPFFSGEERTERLILELARAGVDEAMFFVTTGNLEKLGESGAARIQKYAAAGHTLANHSHSHLWFWRTDTDEYIADMDTAIAHLAEYENVRPLYRFPYLDEGRSVEKRDTFRAALKSRGLGNGYVTVDTYDWHLVSLAAEAKAAGIEVDLDDLRDLYVDVLVTSTEFYDAMATELLGRSPHHVLLLHENDLAAMFIGDLVAELERRGFSVIPATMAFTDPIAGHEPDTLHLGQGRIAALAHEVGHPPADLISPTEDEDYLRRRFEADVQKNPTP